MKKLTAVLMALCAAGLMGCTQPKATMPTKSSKPDNKVETPADKPTDKPADKPVDKPADKSGEKAGEKTPPK